MDERVRQVGERIRAAMPPGMTQRSLAEKVSMKPDALSRALNGLRGFAPFELADIAAALGPGTSVHWLLTGQADPHRLEVAARHDWDPATKTRVNPGRETDRENLKKIGDVYRAAFPHTVPPSIPLPADPVAVRDLLGKAFVRDFADLAEQHLGIDVIRISGLSTDYSLRIGDRGVILLRTSPNWYRSNFSLAHEIGHLALGHHDSNTRAISNEKPADRFAEQLLLPADLINAVSWQDLDSAGLARFVWDCGVSTKALKLRLNSLKVSLPAAIAANIELPTGRLLGAHRYALSLKARPGFDPIAERQQQSTSRRFPINLISALRDRVETGQADPELLGWALGVPLDDIYWPEPADEAAEAESYYQRMMADRPSADELINMSGAGTAT